MAMTTAMTSAMTITTLEDCQQRDAQDPLRHLRDQFSLPAGLIYLDGNSLGALPKTAAARVAQAVTQEWGVGLIRSWNQAGWFEQPQRLGDKIAGLIGANPGEVLATDSTSINLYKVLSAALSIAAHDAPGRNVIVSERSNFPTDLYMAESLCNERGCRLHLVEAQEIHAAQNADVALLMLTHVNYRTGAMHGMAAITAAAHKAGVLTVWDLAHSAGAVPVDLTGSDADFAVGCGYKYLNGGPGAPAFVWANPRHTGRQDIDVQQPLSGWWGHAAPFAFTPGYAAAPGITRYLCGSQPVLSMTALDCGLDSVLAAQPYVRINFEPTERYVTAPANTTTFRLKAWESGYSNLYLAGDWTYTGLNVGCVEATVMSGKLASLAISGYPALSTIIGYSAGAPPVNP